MDWSQTGKGIRQGCILSPCLFNFYRENIMWNGGVDEAQARIKIARRNVNNLRYSDDTTLIIESEEELKSLLLKVKEENEKAGLKLNFQKLRSWHPVISLHGNKWGKCENSVRFHFLGLQNQCRQWLEPWNKKMLTPWKNSYAIPRQYIKKAETSLCQQSSIVSKLFFQ